MAEPRDHHSPGTQAALQELKALLVKKYPE